MNPQPTVHLVDDDPGMLKALSRLLWSEGFEVRAHSSARGFLRDCPPEETACLVLDVEMPDLDGLELQRRLNRAGIALPIVFLTGRGDIPMTVRAIQSGAVDFLTKPVDDVELLRAVRTALKRAASLQSGIAETASLDRRLKSLTPREREVMTQVAAGKLNKQIAAELGTVEQTVKVHRARVMEKMGVQSIADLVRVADRLSLRQSARALPERKDAG